MHNWNSFLCLFSMLRIWFESWHRKWSNPFCMQNVELTAGSQLCSRYCTPVLSAESIYHVPSRTGIWNRNRFWVWFWRNKLFTRIFSRTPAQTYFVFCLTSNFHPFLDIAMCAHYTSTIDGEILQGFEHRQLQKMKAEERYWHKQLKIWRKKKGLVRKQEEKRD